MNSEEAIGRVLQGMASAEPSPSMEHRLVEAVQHRAATREIKGSLWPLARPWAIAAGLAILAIAGSMAVRRRQEPRPNEAVLKQHTSPAAEIAARPAAIAQDISLPLSPRKIVPARSEPLSYEDALAIEEMNAPSKPAPPLPLTHQERLLAEAVHQDSPVELSSLRHEVRDRQMELSKAEFHDFFEPPPAKESE